jgi:hypothetical protein
MVVSVDPLQRDLEASASKSPARRQGVRAQFSKLRRRVLKKRDVQSLYSIFRFGINKCSAADAILHIRRTPANISPNSTAAIHVSLRYRRAAPIPSGRATLG